MKSLKNYWIVLIFVLVLTSLSIMGYSKYKSVEAYNRCMNQQSLDVTRQDAIQEYCLELAKLTPKD